MLERIDVFIVESDHVNMMSCSSFIYIYVYLHTQSSSVLTLEENCIFKHLISLEKQTE